MSVAKVTINGTTVLDLTDATASSNDIVEDYSAYGSTGQKIIGIAERVNNQNKTATPTRSEQVITADSGYTGLGTVTVNPIPPNYGLVTWNGSVLTIT